MEERRFDGKTLVSHTAGVFFLDFFLSLFNLIGVE